MAPPSKKQRPKTPLRIMKAKINSFIFLQNVKAMRRERRQPLAVAYAGLFYDLFTNIRIRPICLFSDLLVFCTRISFLNGRYLVSGSNVPKSGKLKFAFEFILWSFQLLSGSIC